MKSLNNKTLIIILVALAGVFVLVRVFRTPALERNMRKELVSVDTAKVDQIKLWVAGEEQELIFKKENSRWGLEKAGTKYNIEQGSATGMLGYLAKMVPQKVVTRKKDKWNDYQVGDTSTHVQAMIGKDVVADLYIGRIGFNQNPAQMQQQSPYGNGFAGAYTFVRLGDEDEVYTVDGFLESTFSRSLNDWRDKSLLRLKKDMITKLTFVYPDSGFVLQKNDKKWMIADQPADSNKVKTYLGSLEYKNASSFADGFNPNRNPDISLNIDGVEGPIATLQAWKREEADWVLMTSRQPGV